MLSNKVKQVPTRQFLMSDIHGMLAATFLPFQLVLSVSEGRLIHIKRVQGLSFLRATGTTVPAVIAEPLMMQDSTTVANDAYHRPTTVTESGVAIGVNSAASDLPVSEITAKEAR